MRRPDGDLVYEFGAFQLYASQHLLLLKDSGRAVPLTARAFDTLLYFVEHRGELLSKEALMKAVWPNVVVEENNLSQNISALRKMFGETPEDHRFIVTVPGRGYRFVADVHAFEKRPAPAVGAKTDPSAAVPASTRRNASATTSIAILPFANLTGDPAKEYLGDGLAEELINTLTQAPGWFSVPARSSAFVYKGRDVDVRQIARDLDVDMVLEGSVRSAGERLRINAQLIDGRTGYHLWSQSFERKLEDLFALQDELTVALADAMTIGGSAVSSLAHKPPTRDLEAFQLFLRAKSLNQNPTEHNLRSSMEFLTQALERDPLFARAWQGLAVIRGFYFVASDFLLPDALSSGEHDARHALTLDPSLSTSHAVLGFINACRGNWTEAETEIRTALSPLANDPEVHLLHAVYIAQTVGHLRRALEDVEAACRLAPLAPMFALNVAAQKMLDGHDDQALQWIESAVANGLPKNLPSIQDMLAQLARRGARYTEAARCTNDALSPSWRAAGGADAITAFFAALDDQSRTAAAITALQTWERRLRLEELDRLTGHRLMLWYTLLGAVDLAYDVAARLLDRFKLIGSIGIAWGILWMPEMQAFRHHRRFQAFVSRLGLMDYWRQYGPPDCCELREGVLMCT